MKRIHPYLISILLAQGTLWAMTADDLVQKTGIAGGLCAFPRAGDGDGALALQLAKRPTFVVHVQSPSAQVTARIRGQGEAEGILGSSLYVEAASPTLPFADRLVDVMVVSDLRDADLTPALRAEWLRVLAPRRGAALVGRAKASGAGLSAKAVKDWARDLPLTKVIDDDSGVWAVLRADLPAGSDEWTHRCHGPENAQVSDDATLKPPFLTQWWGLPRQQGFWGTTVVAGNGRMFAMRSSRNSGEQVTLAARSLTSGVVLWQRRLRQAPEKEKVPHGGYVPGRSCMVVAGDTVLLIDKDSVLRLDAETGAEQGRIPGPKAGGQIKWIASADGAVAVLAGDPDVVRPIAYQTVSANPTGRDLAVYDAKDNRELWHDTLAGDVDERIIVVRDSRIYCLVQGVGMVCRELRTGKTIWTNPDADLMAEFLTPDTKVVSQLLFSQPVLSAFDDVLLLRAKWAKHTAAFSRADGALLWKNPTAGGSYRALTALAVNGLWLGGGAPIDLKTGKAVEKGPKFVSSGCGPTTAIPGYLITCFGAVQDLTSGKMVRQEDIKSPCDIGSIVAEGLMITVPSECGCNYEVKGYRVLASAGSLQPHSAPAWKDRMTVPDPAEPAALGVTDADWPTYRRDSQRSAASGASVGDSVKGLWRWAPAGAVAYTNAYAGDLGPRLAADFLPTAPVAAAGRVWFAGRDGIVRCVSAADGKPVWTFPTGGMLFAPPTVWNGRVLAAGGDGYVYCLDATTGRCLWRLLAGPADRRVFWFGHLVSTWPVIPGVVVQDNVAYTVAGYQKGNGIHVYAIDAKQGAVLWEKDDAGSGGLSGSGAGLGSAGYTAVGGGKLWLCSSSATPGSFDLKSGDWKPMGSGQFGNEIEVLDGKWVIQGGRRLSETQEALTHPLGNSGFSAYPADSKPGRVAITDCGTTLPAWDADLTVMPPKGLSGGLTAVSTAKILDWLGERANPPKPAANEPKPKPIELADLKTWQTEDMLPIAFALAKDLLVVAHEARGAAGRGYKVSGFRRSDGSKAWTVDLPDQPVMNRLAVDRDGRVLVSLCDGSLFCVGR